MNAIPHSIDYGSRPIRFGVVYAKRKTLQIEVYPDGKVLVKAPNGTRTEEIENRVLRRSRWIRKQLSYFQQFEPRTPPRKYIGGETHLYLGRHYRLKILKAEECTVKLIRGYFLVSVKGKATSQIVNALLDEWYAAKAAIHFQESFKRCWPRFKKKGMVQPRLAIRPMKTRWGSLSKAGRLTLNVDLIRAPKKCIDYVITHELCHLKHHNHSPAFYKLLEQAMPDWKKRKHKLELAMV